MHAIVQSITNTLSSRTNTYNGRQTVAQIIKVEDYE
jgi:hypothetical protein